MGSGVGVGAGVGEGVGVGSGVGSGVASISSRKVERPAPTGEGEALAVGIVLPESGLTRFPITPSANIMPIT